MAAFGAAAYAAKIFLTTDSFYDYGHYRGSSVAEIASDKPKYKGTAYCQSCHAVTCAVSKYTGCSSGDDFSGYDDDERDGKED